MPRSIQIRGLDDHVYEALQRRAAEAGVSVPELLRGELMRLAGRQHVAEWLVGGLVRPMRFNVGVSRNH